ncbi:hypothetical protein F5X68DRAFT_224148 [Plectosphaerella plurivora]|uniref:Uncharacterized protein n=1 Tax=Plectosphaerella plurivora TaxID=936078 RepID=A0A9P8V3C9_9PEZI|nr:hypothetical protein F5X68DRAFT_224148 [Plectosphaerella plurivora]
MASEVAKRPGVAQSQTRNTIATSLLYLAYFFALVIVAIEIVIMLAGSRLVNTDLEKPGPIRLLFSNLAIASFDGIIPDPNSDGAFLVTMHLFVNSFGWEFPSASTKAQTAGIVIPTRDNALYLPRDFIPIGKAVGLDESAWGCFPPNWTGSCESPFFAAFRRQWPYNEAPGFLDYFMTVYFFTCTTLLFLSEILIFVRPHWLKCRCYFRALKRVCPCPKGERHEIERLPSTFWDRWRLWTWPLLPVTVFPIAADTFFRGHLLVRWLTWAPDGDMRGMNPRMGKGFAILDGTAFALSWVAVFCMLARLLLHRKANWMEQQGAVPALEAGGSVGLDNSPAVDGEDQRLGGYTDAEPDAPLGKSAASTAK